MTITHTPVWQKERTETLEQYVSSQFDGYDYEGGQLENLRRTVRHQNKAFARLLDILAQKEIVSAPDITEIVRGVRDNAATLSD